jgi:tetratricopeptide (TPR) repeat protein
MFDNLNRMISSMPLDQAMEKASAAQRLGDKKSEALYRLLIAKMHLEEGSLDQCASEARAAIVIFRAIKNLIGEASCILILAQSEYLRGNFSKAQADYETALAIYNKSGDLTGEALTHLGLAAVHFDNPARKDPSKVKEHLNKAMVIYQRLGDFQSQKSVMEMLKIC